MLDAFGIVSPPVAAAAGQSSYHLGAYRVLRRMEEAGQVRRGYFVRGLTPAQFATSEAIDLVRRAAASMNRADGSFVTGLNATDPANPFGSILPWPRRPDGGRLPVQRVGRARVVLAGGRLAAWIDSSSGAVVLVSEDDADVDAVADVLRRWARASADMTIKRVDGHTVLTAKPEELSPTATRLLQDLERDGFVLTPRGLRASRLTLRS